MTKELTREEYYKALEKAVNEVILSMTGTRKDVAKRLLLGAVVGRNATEIAQEAEMNYETVLNNLDKAAQVNLIEVVKKLVGDHPVLLIIDDTHDHKLYARAMPVSRNGAQIFYCRAHKRFESAIQLLVIGVKDLVNNQIYVIHIIAYIPRKVEEELKRRGEEVKFKTKIDALLEFLSSLSGLNVKSKVFDSWYVNSRTLQGNTVGELKSSARVVESGRSVPVSEFPQGEYLVEYLGTPIKLLVIDDYKGYGRRYFFSTDLNDTAEDIITTWENRWDIEVLIRELKALGLEGGSFLTWVRNSGFVALKALSLLVVQYFKYSTGLMLGAKRLARLIKSIYREAGGIKKLFKRRRKP
ncbi:ISNCY family transposase [Saccharolobus solfataricus]|uniref:Transposase ISC1217 n=3 Tax=Saccharolobus solfataricus TaxID=2287 RepID=Q97XR1_SACS2|nr:transposase [Saccharolobus solfataricus]AAK41862.1 Transposase ISC1217 [Saccharolobus solfataricus P2]AKA74595.1 ISNCY family transposase [Saccharolobus solfataricus]AKA77291.1 ISNCY family transposase [Saccharolobus solfataricus]AKA79982.1 ISNCY family transposase [Saccharolobus solfataricus]AZF69064.1 ISNCY family transposase [Saccharolobus solfataricus]